MRLPAVETLDGTALLIDIAGSTKLGVRLSRLGGSGLERFQVTLTGVFADVAEIVEAAGGTILGVEGDALLAGWRCEADDDRQDTLSRCCRAALELCGVDGRHRIDGDPLSLRMAIGMGEIRLLHLGRDGSRCFFLPAGTAIAEAKRLIARADTSEIILSGSVAAALPPGFTTAAAGEQTLRLTGNSAPMPTETADRPASGSVPGALDRYLPPVVTRMVTAEAEDWSGDIRVVSAVFVCMSTREGPLELDTVNELVLLGEAVCDAHRGELLDLVLEGDALTLVWAHGLPGGSSGDHGLDAVQAGEDLRDRLQNSAITVSVGVATGKVLSGPLGAPSLRIYTIMGVAMNTAARLCAIAAGRTLVDDVTARLARSVSFSGPWPIQIPGLRREALTFVVQRTPLPQTHASDVEVIGRAAERDRLVTLLDDIGQGGSSVVLIEGEAGVGKSTLIAAFIDAARERGFGTIECSAEALDPHTPYLAWRSIVQRVLSFATGSGPLPDFLERLEAAGTHPNFAPLLNDVMDVQIPENRVTAGMSQAVRAANRHALLRSVITHQLLQAPQVIVIEDVHWMDDSSWRLLSDILGSAPHTLFVLSSRSGPLLDGVLACCATHGIPHRRMPLDRLDRDDTLEMIARRLGGAGSGSSLAQAIAETSGGNPLFVDELCQLVAMQDPEGRSGPPGGEATMELSLPHRLESAILGRVDGLPAESQRLLKIASVAGAVFDETLVANVAASIGEPGDPSTAMEGVVARRLIARQPDRDGVFSFRHRMIRNVIYNSMLSSRRSRIHRAYAETLEQAGGESDVVVLPMLLEHWRQAGDVERTARYLQAVAALRLRQFDNASAIRLVDELFEHLEQHTLVWPRDRLAGLHLIRARASVGMGQMEAAKANYHRGLAELDHAVPRTRLGLFAAIGQLAVTQAVRRLRAYWHPRRDLISPIGARGTGQTLHRIAEAHEDLTRIAYFAGDKPALIHSSLAAVCRAEDMPKATPALAVSYAVLGAICSSIPLRGSSRYYIGHAKRLAEVFDEPGISSRVALPCGLFHTGVGKWLDAERELTDGMRAAESVGDERLWCELAVVLETIWSPFSMTPRFPGVATWEDLARRIEDTGRRRADNLIVASAILGRLRGARLLGRWNELAELREEIDRLGIEYATEVELIHRIEVAAEGARATFERGDADEGDRRLARAHTLLADLQATMKARTLPSLTTLFEVSLWRAGTVTDNERPAALRRVGDVLRKLRHLAHIFPICRPHALLCAGDLAAFTSGYRRAAPLWRKAVAAAAKYEVATAAEAATARLAQEGSIAPVVSAEKLSEDRRGLTGLGVQHRSQSPHL